VTNAKPISACNVTSMRSQIAVGIRSPNRGWPWLAGKNITLARNPVRLGFALIYWSVFPSEFQLAKGQIPTVTQRPGSSGVKKVLKDLSKRERKYEDTRNRAEWPPHMRPDPIPK
jgi:hypothetical protein